MRNAFVRFVTRRVRAFSLLQTKAESPNPQCLSSLIEQLRVSSDVLNGQRTVKCFGSSSVDRGNASRDDASTVVTNGMRGRTNAANTKANVVKREEDALKTNPNSAPAFPFVASSCMVLSVMASNYLVQFPLSDWFTVGSFTYPVAFLITDVTNRIYGPKRARLIVYTGFAAGLPMSLIFSPVRIALSSGSAFLTSQLIDVLIFDSLRRKAWWKAPLISTMISSFVDSYLFTFLAFYGDPSMPSWVTLATGDYGIKVAVAVASLGPFKILIKRSLLSSKKKDSS